MVSSVCCESLPDLDAALAERFAGFALEQIRIFFTYTRVLPRSMPNPC